MYRSSALSCATGHARAKEGILIGLPVFGLRWLAGLLFKQPVMLILCSLALAAVAAMNVHDGFGDTSEATLPPAHCSTNGPCCRSDQPPPAHPCWCPGYEGSPFHHCDTADGFCDSDCDGICDVDPSPHHHTPLDNCTYCANQDQLDSDNDGPGDSCDVCPYDSENDSDGDGVCEHLDNCPDAPNTDQNDSDSNGIGDACESEETEPTTPPGEPSFCIPPSEPPGCFPDDDFDGVYNGYWTIGADLCSHTHDPLSSIADCPAATCCMLLFGAQRYDLPCALLPGPDGIYRTGCPLTIPGIDNCPDYANPDQLDSDQDGLGDPCDPCPLQFGGTSTGTSGCPSSTTPTPTSSPTAAVPTQTPEPSATATPEATASPEATAQPTASTPPTSTPTPALTSSPAPSSTPIESPSPTASAAPTISATPDSSATSEPTATPAATGTAQAEATSTPASDDCLLYRIGCPATSTATPTATPTISEDCILYRIGCPATPPPTPPGTFSPTPGSEETPPATATPAATGTISENCLLYRIGCPVTPTATPTATPTPSDDCILYRIGCPATPTATPTVSDNCMLYRIGCTPTPAATQSPTPRAGTTPAPTETPTPTPSSSASYTPTAAPTETVYEDCIFWRLGCPVVPTPTYTPTPTGTYSTITPTPTETVEPTATPTETPTPAETPTVTPTPEATETPETGSCAVIRPDTCPSLSSSQLLESGSADFDGDTYPDGCDNCLVVYNPGQEDNDGDGAGDSCDYCPGSDKYEPGSFGCYATDQDTDRDGTADAQETCYADPEKTEPGACGCNSRDIDSDGDGILDCEDPCPTIAYYTTPDCRDYPVSTDEPTEMYTYEAYRNTASLTQSYSCAGRPIAGASECSEYCGGDSWQCYRCCDAFYPLNDPAHDTCEVACDLNRAWKSPPGQNMPPVFAETTLVALQQGSENKGTEVKSACGTEAQSVAAQAYAILAKECETCHTKGGKRGGFALDKLVGDKYVFAREKILAFEPKVQEVKIGGKPIPMVSVDDEKGTGDPDKSLLVHMITSDKAKVGATNLDGLAYMPQRADNSFLPPEQVATIRKWIEEGFKAPGGCDRKTQQFTELDIMKAIYFYLKSYEANKSKYLRFFYFPAYNDPCTDECILQKQRAALSFVINSLHQDAGMYYPAPVDAEKILPHVSEKDKAKFKEIGNALFVLDIEKISRFSQNWAHVAGAYTLSLDATLTYNNNAKNKTIKDGSSDITIANLAKKVYEKTGTRVPYVRADWFILTATRSGPTGLYHRLLGLQNNTFELEFSLGLNTQKVKNKPVPVAFHEFVYSAPPDKGARRSGLVRSNVTTSNRIIDSHCTKFGRYWRSYDVKNKDDKRNFTENPLGPQDQTVFYGGVELKKIENQFGDVYPQDKDSKRYLQTISAEFLEDGGEIIWNLPNGLQAYFLTNANDEMVHEVPIQVAYDTTNVTGERNGRVRNGISCMACHANGMISYTPNLLGDITSKNLFYTDTKYDYWVYDIGNETTLKGWYTGWPNGYFEFWSPFKYISFKSKLDALFAKEEEVAKSLKDGEKLFLEAFEKAVKPYVGSDANFKIIAPMITVSLRYYTRLGAYELATEVGLSSETIVAAIKDNNQFSDLTTSGSIARNSLGRTSTWNDLFASAVLQNFKSEE